MAAPTDLLNEDVKELKADLREIRSDINVLKADVHRIDVGLAELRAEVRLSGRLVALLLAMAISGIGWGIWQTATLTNEVRHLASPEKAPSSIRPDLGVGR